MRTLRLIVMIIVGVLAVAVIGLFILIKTFDLNQYLPKIEEAASQSLGHPVQIGSGRLDMAWQGIMLRVGEVKIFETAQPGSRSMLSVDSADLSLDLPPLIFQRKIQIRHISLAQPKMQIVRLASGELNINPPASAPAAGASPSGPGSAGPAEVSVPQSFPEISAKSIVIKGASIDFIDQNPQAPLHLVVPNIDLNVEQFSLESPFAVHIQAAVLNSQNNLQGSAQVRLDLAKSQVAVNDLQIRLDLATINLDQLKIMVPSLAGVPWPTDVKGSLLADLPAVTASAKGLAGLQGTVKLSNGSLKMKEIASEINHVEMYARLTTSQADISGLSFQLGGGQVDVRAEVRDYLAGGSWTSQMTFKGINVEQVTAPNSMPVVIKGQVNGTAALSGASFDPKDLTGQADVEMVDAVIEQLNIVKTVLGATVGIIPGLPEAIDSLLTGALKEKLGTDSTQLTKVQAKLSIGNSVLNITDATAVSRAFEAKATGTVGFDLKTQVPVTVWLDPDVTEDVVKRVPQLSYLTDEDGKRLRLTGEVAGVLPDVRFNPSPIVKNVTRKAIAEEGIKGLEKVIEKNPEVGAILDSLFGGGQPQTNSQLQEGEDRPDTQGGESPDEEERPGTKAINSLLNSIFK